MTVIGLFPLGFIMSFPLQIFVGTVVHIGWLFLCLRALRGERADSLQVFSAFRRYGSAWLTSILYSLIFLAGLLLCVVPGIIWAIKYSMCYFVVMDKNFSSTESLAVSGRITEGHKGKIFLLYLGMTFLGLLGIPFFYGLQSLRAKPNILLLILGFIPYLASLLILTPLFGTTLAACYESLLKAKEAEED